MSFRLDLQGAGGAIVLLIVVIAVGVGIYTSPEMVDPLIETVQEKPLIAGGFVVLLVGLFIFGDAGPGEME
jgi:hypothetical protein